MFHAVFERQAPIPAGTWTMTATALSSSADLPVTLTADTVHTEVVVDSTGFGGTAPHGRGSPLPWLAGRRQPWCSSGPNRLQ